ncbi:MAG: hypothetical protein ACQEP8_04400 [Chlamydiota bacterium]
MSLQTLSGIWPKAVPSKSSGDVQEIQGRLTPIQGKLSDFLAHIAIAYTDKLVKQYSDSEYLAEQYPSKQKVFKAVGKLHILGGAYATYKKLTPDFKERYIKHFLALAINYFSNNPDELHNLIQKLEEISQKPKEEQSQQCRELSDTLIPKLCPESNALLPSFPGFNAFMYKVVLKRLAIPSLLQLGAEQLQANKLPSEDEIRQQITEDSQARKIHSIFHGEDSLTKAIDEAVVPLALSKVSELAQAIIAKPHEELEVIPSTLAKAIAINLHIPEKFEEASRQKLGDDLERWLTTTDPEGISSQEWEVFGHLTASASIFQEDLQDLLQTLETSQEDSGTAELLKKFLPDYQQRFENYTKAVSNHILANLHHYLADPQHEEYLPTLTEQLYQASQIPDKNTRNAEIAKLVDDFLSIALPNKGADIAVIPTIIRDNIYDLLKDQINEHLQKNLQYYDTPHQSSDTTISELNALDSEINLGDYSSKVLEEAQKFGEQKLTQNEDTFSQQLAKHIPFPQPEEGPSLLDAIREDYIPAATGKALKEQAFKHLHDTLLIIIKKITTAHFATFHDKPLIPDLLTRLQTIAKETDHSTQKDAINGIVKEILEIGLGPDANELKNIPGPLRKQLYRFLQEKVADYLQEHITEYFIEVDAPSEKEIISRLDQLDPTQKPGEKLSQLVTLLTRYVDKYSQAEESELSTMLTQKFPQWIPSKLATQHTGEDNTLGTKLMAILRKNYLESSSEEAVRQYTFGKTHHALLIIINNFTQQQPLALPAFIEKLTDLETARMSDTEKEKTYQKLGEELLELALPKEGNYITKLPLPPAFQEPLRSLLQETILPSAIEYIHHTLRPPQQQEPMTLNDQQEKTATLTAEISVQYLQDDLQALTSTSLQVVDKQAIIWNILKGRVPSGILQTLYKKIYELPIISQESIEGILKSAISEKDAKAISAELTEKLNHKSDWQDLADFLIPKLQQALGDKAEPQIWSLTQGQLTQMLKQCFTNLVVRIDGLADKDSDLLQRTIAQLGHAFQLHLKYYKEALGELATPIDPYGDKATTQQWFKAYQSINEKALHPALKDFEKSPEVQEATKLAYIKENWSPVIMKLVFPEGPKSLPVNPRLQQTLYEQLNDNIIPNLILSQVINLLLDSDTTNKFIISLLGTREGPQPPPKTEVPERVRAQEEGELIDMTSLGNSVIASQSVLTPVIAQAITTIFQGLEGADLTAPPEKIIGDVISSKMAEIFKDTKPSEWLDKALALSNPTDATIESPEDLEQEAYKILEEKLTLLQAFSFTALWEASTYQIQQKVIIPLNADTKKAGVALRSHWGLPGRVIAATGNIFSTIASLPFRLGGKLISKAFKTTDSGLIYIRKTISRPLFAIHKIRNRVLGKHKPKTRAQKTLDLISNPVHEALVWRMLDSAMNGLQGYHLKQK